MSGLLQDKVCIVTGASRGIGRDTAHRLAAEGAILLLASRKIETAEETAAAIRSQGGRASAFAADVTDPEAMRLLVEHCEALHGRLDLAFNNAGRLVGGGLLHETPLERYRTHIDTNLGGVFHSLRAELELMVRTGGGAIVVNSAGSGLRPRPNVADYSASKMGVIGLCQAAAQEYGPLGIRINVVAPGYIGTDA